MRVAVVNPVGGIGGAERVLLDLLRFGQAPGVTFVVVALGGGPLVEKAAALGAEVEVVPMPERLAALGDSPVRAGGVVALAKTALGTAARGLEAARFSRALCERLVARRPDVVHSNGLKVHLLLAPLRGRVPVVWHLHDFIGERPLMRYGLRAAAGSAAAALCISRAVGEDARRWLPGVRCEVVPNGVDVERFSPGGAVAELDRLAGLPEAPAGTARVGMVATYARWKGQEVFLQAASQVDARCYVVGGPVYRSSGSQFSLEELKGLAARLGVEGRVGFVPFQERVEEVYRALDVVVHASTRPEPFGLTIAEAMACGRPLIASRAGGAAELFEDGVEAVGLPEVSAGSLARAISGLLADPVRREALGKAARAGAVARHSSERFAADVLGLYRSIAEVRGH